MSHKIIDELGALATPVTNLVEMPGNPRRGDVEAIARSFRVFGQRKPLVARRTGTDETGQPVGYITAGNHGLKAARDELGWSHVAVVWIDEDATTSAAYALADNRTGDLGGYDRDLLMLQLQEVAANASAELFAATAYTEDDLLAMVGHAEPETEPDPAIPPLPDTAITQPGDIWVLGNHRLICGDCRDAEVMDKLLNGVSIAVAFTSPPYADRRAYDTESGFEPVAPEAYVEWFAPVSANVAAHLNDDGSWFVNIKAGADELDTNLYVLDLVTAHVREWGWHFATELCWERNGVPKHVRLRFKNQFEPVYQFTRGRWKVRPHNVAHRSDNAIVSLGKGSGATTWDGKQGSGRNLIGADRKMGNEEWRVMPGLSNDIRNHQGTGRSLISDARRRHASGSYTRHQGKGGDEGGEFFAGDRDEGWAFPGNRLPPFTGSHEATGHAAAFPVGLPEWFVKAYSDPLDTILDPFAGSGSTLLAAQRTNRVSYNVEISPKYCDVICRRYQSHIGLLPTRNGEEVDFSI